MGSVLIDVVDNIMIFDIVNRRFEPTLTYFRVTTISTCARLGIMVVVDNILVSDELVEASFTCNLSACLGACCVQGDSGAPLEPAERKHLEDVFPIVREKLRPEALEVIESKGVWEKTTSGEYAATCVGTSECVFVRYDRHVAKCTIQEAYLAGNTTFEKPVSCHLYPIRVTDLGDFDALNYEQIEICKPGVKSGVKHGTFLSDYLEKPLVRKYGSDWYARFREACYKRRHVFQETRQ